MAAKTAAQEEFDNIFTTSTLDPSRGHPEDLNSTDGDELDEESKYKESKIQETMRQPIYDRSTSLRLPPPSFDSGRTTGVKGVIADARSFEAAKRGKSNARINGSNSGTMPAMAAPILRPSHHKQEKIIARGRNREGESYFNSDSEDEDEEFLMQWREARKREIMREGSDIRNRRTSPSMRRYGRFDEVDALGYLDAIERVGRDTVVVVFVYDSECPVSQVIESALSHIVPAHPAIHFVKVAYDEIEFDNAGVPAILAYRNQGDLFANLTYVVDQMPEDTAFDSTALKEVLRRHHVL